MPAYPTAPSIAFALAAAVACGALSPVAFARDSPTRDSLDAQGEPAVLMLDTGMARPYGARMRVGFERLPAAGETAVWVDPDGRLDNALVALAAGGGMLGFAFGDAHAQRERDATIRPLIDGVARGDRLRTLMEEEVRASVAANGYAIHRTLRADGVNKAHVYQGLTRPADGLAVVVQQPRGIPALTLSWDNRQPLLALDLYFYERREGKKLAVRETRRRALRYVGHAAPAGQDPRAYWAADDGAAFVAEVRAGLRRLLPLAWDDALAVPKVTRKDTVTLRVEGAATVFPGRLWKEEAGVAYLFNDDKGITLVATGGPPAAVAP